MGRQTNSVTGEVNQGSLTCSGNGHEAKRRVASVGKAWETRQGDGLGAATSE